MAPHFDNLPEDIRNGVLAFVREVDGRREVTDIQGLAAFVVQHADAYPDLLNIFTVNEEAVIQHFKDTGDVPPGVKIIKTTTVEGENVTKLEIFHPPRDRD